MMGGVCAISHAIRRDESATCQSYPVMMKMLLTTGWELFNDSMIGTCEFAP